MNLNKKPLQLFLYFRFYFLIVLFTACSSPKFRVSKIAASAYKIEQEYPSNAKIDSFIKPYHDKIDADLNKVLAFAPQTLDKKGEWQTTIGNLIATLTLDKSNSVFEQRTHHKIDFCILNSGGIRSIIPKGEVTLKTAYEIQPFENSAVVLELKGDVVLEIINYIIKEKKPHPVAGISFTIDRNNQPQNILIQDKIFDVNQNYYVVTSDYLSNGGDRMDFFSKRTNEFNLDYKLRNMIIDYFTEVDSLPVLRDIRISKD